MRLVLAVALAGCGGELVVDSPGRASSIEAGGVRIDRVFVVSERAECPPGAFVVAGGCSCSSQPITISAADFDDNAWDCRCENGNIPLSQAACVSLAE